VARRLTDKIAQRDALRRAGLPTPETAAIHNRLDDIAVKELALRSRFPAVLKSIHGTDSRMTVRVDDAEELMTALRSFGDGRSDMVLEAYLPDGPPCFGESPTTCPLRALLLLEISSTSR
jgi:glutathione synthase/RimK-type ligase-like ATP-grasp enzyme